MIDALRFLVAVVVLMLLAPPAPARVSVYMYGGYAVSEGIDKRARS